MSFFFLFVVVFFLFFLFFTNKNKPITKSTSKYEVSLEEGKQASWNGRRKEGGRVFTRERRGEEKKLMVEN